MSDSVFDMCLNRVGSFMDSHGNLVYSVISTVGLGATIFCTVKDTIRVKNKLDEQLYSDRERVGLIAKNYIPTAIAASLTAGSVWMNYKYNDNKAAMLYSAYAQTLTAFEAYKLANKTVNGQEAVDKIEEVYVEAAGKKMGEVPAPGYDLYFFPYANIFIEEKRENILKALLDLNTELGQAGMVNTKYFFNLLGVNDCLGPAFVLEGWSTDGDFLSFSGVDIINLNFTEKKTAKGKPYFVAQFNVPPSLDYADSYERWVGYEPEVLRYLEEEYGIDENNFGRNNIGN